MDQAKPAQITPRKIPMGMSALGQTIAKCQSVTKAFNNACAEGPKLPPRKKHQFPDRKEKYIKPKHGWKDLPWQKLRYAVLRVYGRKCMCCFRTDQPVHVDHIKPKSKYPQLMYVFENLQVLCFDCNMGKSYIDETDWRSEADLKKMESRGLGGINMQVQQN